MLPRICFCALACLSLLGAEPDLVASAAPFEFHSNFWINLHHFIYQQAAESHNRLELDPSLADAVQYYKTHIVSHDLLFDEAMNRIDTVLASAGQQESLSPAVEIDAALRTHLNAAASDYRARWWPAHDRANRFWIAVALPLVNELGGRLAQQLAAAYQSSWPKDPVRVDVTVYANWAGAYTYGGQHIHTLISSEDPGYQGLAALEMLFHEAGHGLIGPPGGKLVDAIDRESTVAGIPVPRDLLHAVIFYTAGELVRRDLAGYGVAHYEPYALKNGLYARVGWTRYQSALDLFWRPYLDGGLTLDGAVSRIVRALAVTSPHQAAP